MSGRKADVIKAAYWASEIAHRMVVPGGEVGTLSLLFASCYYSRTSLFYCYYSILVQMPG